MTVSVPIDGNPSGIIRAIGDMRAALKAAGADAAQLSSIDLSKLNSKELADDLARAAQNLKDLTSIGRGETATAARRMFGKDPGIDAVFDLEEHAKRMFPDPRDRQRFMDNAGGFVFRGTSFDPASRPPPAPAPPSPPGPPAPPPPAPPPTDKEESAGYTALLATVKRGIAGGAGFMLAEAGLNSIKGASHAALSYGGQDNDALDALFRRTGDLAMSFDKLREITDRAHRGLLMTQIDFDRYTGMFAQAANVSGYEAARGTRIAVGMAQAYGGDAGAFTRGFGQASFLGIKPETFAEMVGSAAVRGSMGGRVEEVMGALLHWTENQAKVSATGAALTGNTLEFSNLYTAMEASKMPMFAGGNAEQIIGQVNNSITNGGGGGLAGQVLVTRALMRAGMSDPYAMQMQLARGAFGRVGGMGPTNFEAISGELAREYGPLGADRAALAAGQLFGLNPLVAQQLMRLPKNHMSIGDLNHALAPFGGVEGVNPSALPDIARAQTANYDQLNVMRKNLLKQGGLSDHNMQLLSNAHDTAGLREAVTAALAQGGMPQTDASRATDASNRMTDAFTHFGEGLINVMTPLEKNTAALLDPLGRIAEALSRNLRPDPTELPGMAPAPTRSAGPVAGMDAGGLLHRIGLQESQMGKTSAHIYGETGAAFLEDVKGLAKDDPTVAAMIAGLSDAQIKALETKDNAALQQRTAAWRLRNIVGPQMNDAGMGMSDMGTYAMWTFGKLGSKVMKAADSTALDSILTPEILASNPEYRGMTVGKWKEARSGLFSESSFGSPYDKFAPQEIKVTPGGPIKIVVDHANRGPQTSYHDVGWASGGLGNPMPHGVAHDVARGF